MKKSWKLTEKILTGQKKIESRWYMTRRQPWNTISPGDVVYFKDSGEPVKIAANVEKVIKFEDLTPEKVREILEKYGSDDGISVEDKESFITMFSGKKYCMLIFLKNPRKVEPFDINKKGYGMMSAWISIDDINKLKVPFKMPANFDKKSIRIIQNVDEAISVMRDAGKWLLESGKRPSKWWQLQNLNRKFLFQYAKEEEFFVGLVDNRPTVAAILQISQKAQDWKSIDKGAPQPALYIHWLCVHRQFAGMGMPKAMIDFATQLAKEKNIGLLRVDADAKEMNLRKIYENLGFRLVGVEQEDYRKTAFYQKKINGE